MPKNEEEVTVNRLAAQVAWTRPSKWDYGEDEPRDDYNRRSIRYVAAGEFLVNWQTGKVPVGWKRPRLVEDFEDQFSPEIIEKVKRKIELNKAEALAAEQRRIEALTKMNDALKEAKKKGEEVEVMEEESKPSWVGGGVKLKSQAEVEAQKKEEEEKEKTAATPWLAKSYVQEEEKKVEPEVKEEDGKPEWAMALQKKKKEEEEKAEAERKKKEEEETAAKQKEEEEKAAAPAWANALKKKEEASPVEDKPKVEEQKAEEESTAPAWANALKKKVEDQPPVEEKPKVEKPKTEEESTERVAPAWANMLKKKEDTPPVVAVAAVSEETKKDEDDTPSGTPAWVGMLKKKSEVTSSPVPPTPELDKGLGSTTPGQPGSDGPSWIKNMYPMEESMQDGFKLPEKVDDREPVPITPTEEKEQPNPFGVTLVRSGSYGNKTASPKIQPSTSYQKGMARTESGKVMSRQGSSSSKKNLYAGVVKKYQEDTEATVVDDENTIFHEDVPKHKQGSSSKMSSRSSSLKRSSSTKDRKERDEMKHIIDKLTKKVDNLEAIIQTLIEKVDQLSAK